MACDCCPSEYYDEANHEADCLRFFEDLTTAADITAVRRNILWMSAQVPDDHPSKAFHRWLDAKLAAGLTARAVELGLERP